MKCPVQLQPRPYFPHQQLLLSSCNPSVFSQRWAYSVNQLQAHTLQKPGCFHRTVLPFLSGTFLSCQQILCSCYRRSLLKILARSWLWLRRRFSPSHYFPYFLLFLSLGQELLHLLPLAP